MNSPYLYFGMWRATFCWHVEDSDLHAINFIHHGAPKTWYCIPPKYGHLMEKAARDLFPEVAPHCTAFLRHKIALISPEVLQTYGVPVVKMVHRAREIIVVFPYAYHCGFNHGFNIAESTNFANERWIEYGKRHRPCDCKTETVKVDMIGFVARYQPHLLEKWKKGADIAPHPEDPPEVKNEIERRAKAPREYAAELENRLKRKDPILCYELKDGSALLCDPILKDILARPRLGWNPEEEERYLKWRKNMADYVCADIYRHIELRHVEVYVDPVTLTCLDYNGLSFLKRRLVRRDFKSFEDLVQCGEMFRVDRLMIRKSDIRQRELKKELVEPVVREENQQEPTGDGRGADANGSSSLSLATTNKQPEEAAADSDDDVDSYYSSESDLDYESSESSGDEERESDYDDPDFGKPKRKRRRQSWRRKRARPNENPEEISVDISRLVRALSALKEEGVTAAENFDNKENVPKKKETNGANEEERQECVAVTSGVGLASTLRPLAQEGGQVYFDVYKLLASGKLPKSIPLSSGPALKALFLGLGLVKQQVM